MAAISVAKRTLQSAVAATGNGTAMKVNGRASAGLQVTGTFVGTLTFEGAANEDSQTWVEIPAVNQATGISATTTTGTGFFILDTSGLDSIRARVSAYTSGSITVVGREVPSGYGGGPSRRTVNVTVFASAARTADPTAFDGVNSHGSGLHVVLDVTAITATPSLTLTIQGKDAVSGKFYTLLAGAAVTTVSTNVYKVYPGLTAVANATANDLLTRDYRIIVAHGDTDSATYSVGASIIP